MELRINRVRINRSRPVRHLMKHYPMALSLPICSLLQGLFVPFACVGSGDPVRVLRLFHNKYTGYN